MKKIQLLEPQNKDISIKRQCSLLGISRTQHYYKKKLEKDENYAIMDEIDKQYLLTPFYGARRFKVHIERKLGIVVNIKRISRLMRKMGIEAIYRKPNLSKRNKAHNIYPYLLRNVPILNNDHVWSTDITYIPMKGGYMYLTAIIDWYSRYVISWAYQTLWRNQIALKLFKMP